MGAVSGHAAASCQGVGLVVSLTTDFFYSLFRICISNHEPRDRSPVVL